MLNGSLSNCVLTVVAGLNVNQIAIGNSYAYITTSNGVLACFISSNGSLSNCTTTASDLYNTTGIAVIPGTTIQGGLAYIISGDRGHGGVVNSCWINYFDSGVVLSNCQPVSGNGTSGVSGIALDNVELYTYLIGGLSNGLEVCESVGGENYFICSITGSELPSPSSITIGSNGYAYSSNGLKGVYVCSIAPNQSLSNCTPTANGIVEVFGVAISNNYAYITSDVSPINVCSVNTDGSLSNCAPTASGVGGTAISIAIASF